MSIISWILLGLVSGFLGSKIVNGTGEGLVIDILLGIAGAIAGGWLFSFFSHVGVTGFNLYSVVIATGGSIVVLAVYHLFRRL